LLTKIEVIDKDVNMFKREELELPIHVEFARNMRVITVFLTLVIMAYVIYYITTQVYDDTRLIFKILPFVILFVLLEPIYKNLFTPYKISLTEEALVFTYLAKKRLIINWADLKKIEKYKGRGKFFLLHYTDNGIDKKFYMSMVFKDILHILTFIKIIAPHIETDDYVSSLLLGE
jgi:hypothetical protein